MTVIFISVEEISPRQGNVDSLFTVIAVTSLGPHATLGATTSKYAAFARATDR